MSGTSGVTFVIKSICLLFPCISPEFTRSSKSPNPTLVHSHPNPWQPLKLLPRSVLVEDLWGTRGQAAIRQPNLHRVDPLLHLVGTNGPDDSRNGVWMLTWVWGLQNSLPLKLGWPQMDQTISNVCHVEATVARRALQTCPRRGALVSHPGLPDDTFSPESFQYPLADSGSRPTTFPPTLPVSLQPGPRLRTSPIHRA